MTQESIKKQVESLADLNRSKEIQHKPIQLDDSTKVIKELARRLENVEKKVGIWETNKSPGQRQQNK